MVCVCLRRRMELGGGKGGAAPLLSLSFFFRKPVLSVHHIKEDIQAIHMQMLRVI